MGKKRSVPAPAWRQFTIAQKSKLKSSLRQALRLFLSLAIEQLKLPESSEVVPTAGGQLSVVVQGVKQRYEPTENASHEVKTRFMTAVFIQWLLSRHTSPSFIDTALGFVMGWGSGAIAVVPELMEMHAKITRLIEPRVRGGKASAKWTPEVQALALPIFDDLKRSRLSNSSACQRLSARLHSEHGISISARTLERHLAGNALDNA